MKKILILDSNSIINRAFYGIRTLNAPDGTPTNAIYGFLNILMKLISDHKPDSILAAFDLKSPTFRHKLYSEYKANRHGMPDELAVQLPVMKDILSYMNIPILELEGYEADDIIGTVSRMCAEKSYECFIATGDRDDLQLAGGGTTVILTSAKQGQSVTELYDDGAVFEKYGVNPIEFIDMKALMGDSSDNIPGVKGIGEKTASKLISQFGNIENMYENIDTANVSEKIKNNLIIEKETAFLSKTLATIDKYVPIDLNIDEHIFSENSSEYSPLLYELLMKLGLKSVIKKLELTPAETTEKTICSDFFKDKICECISSAEEFAELAGRLGNKIAVYLKTEPGKLCAIAFSDSTKAYCASPEITDNGLLPYVSGILEDEAVAKYVFSAKDAIVNLNGLTKINGIKFDVKIGSYLLNPSKSSEIDSLAAEFLGVYLDDNRAAQLSLLDDIPVNRDSQYASIIFALAEIIAEKIEENSQHDLYYNVELPLINVLADMQISGFSVDSTELERFGNFLRDRIEALQSEIYELAGEEFNINSPKQLGDILFGKLGLKGGKKNRNGYSTKADILEKLAPDNKIVRLVLEYRTHQKLKSTYCDGLSVLVNPKTGRIHSIFHQTGTVTGRLSSSDPNMQNIPTRTELGRELRKMFTAKDGCTLIDADYSQIELRVLAHLAKDTVMIDAFKSGEDIHAVTASKILNIPIENLTKEERNSAKAINFGIVYGMSEYTLAQDLGISFAEAKKYMNEYFNKYENIRKYLDSLKDFARDNGYITTLMNRIRYIPELKATQATVRSFGERAAMNTPVQGSAADIMKYAMVRVYNRLKSENLKSKIILQVHDELIIEAPFEEEEHVKEILKNEMENAVTLDVPLMIDMESGKSWYDAK